MYHVLLDNSTEFVCEWCKAEGLHIRAKFCYTLCVSCEALHLENRRYTEETEEAIRTENKNQLTPPPFKNVIIHSPDYYDEKINKPTTYSPYVKAQQIKTKVKLINPIKLKH